MVFKRNKTRLDCRKEGFSGIRKCEISNNFEIWVCGNMRKEVQEVAIQLNPNAVAEAYAEVFALDPKNVHVL